MRHILLAFAFLLLTYPAYGEGSYDLQVQSGFALGTIRHPKSVGLVAEEKLTIGGADLGFSVLHHLVPELSVMGGYSILLDMINNQIGRQGLSGGIQYHLVGGPKEMIIENPSVRLVSSSKQQLSLCATGALMNYSFATKDLSKKISGSTYEMRVGALFRRASYGVELMQTIFSIPGSNERLQTQITDFTLFLMF